MTNLYQIQVKVNDSDNQSYLININKSVAFHYIYSVCDLPANEVLNAEKLAKLLQIAVNQMNLVYSPLDLDGQMQDTIESHLLSLVTLKMQSMRNDSN